MPLNRRSFLKLAATTTAGLVALPRFARAASLDSVAPSNRIAIGVIGVGGGLTLILTSPSKSSQQQAKGLFVQPGLGRVDATWRF